jgi:hypothetical protein
MSGRIPDEKIEEENTAKWTAARELVGLLRVSPRFISTAIHFLRLDVHENNNQLSHNAKGALIPLLRSKAFKAVVYYTAKKFYPEKLKDKKLYTPQSLTEIFTPAEFISLISLTYLYRRMRRGCDKELFITFMRNIHQSVILSAATGRAIEKIGFANGILYGTIIYFAQCIFLGIDKKRFTPYRVHLRRNQISFDLQYEERTWGCNSLQLAALLGQHLGLGRHYHDPIILGIGANNVKNVENSPHHVYAAKLLQVWVESLITTGEAPDMMHKGEYYPLASEMARLKNFAAETAEDMSEKFLFENGENDISPKLTPELFRPNNEDTNINNISISTETKVIELYSESAYNTAEESEDIFYDTTEEVEDVVE